MEEEEEEELCLGDECCRVEAEVAKVEGEVVDWDACAGAEGEEPARGREQNLFVPD